MSKAALTDMPRRHPDAAFRKVGDEGGLVVLSDRAQVKVLNPAGIVIFSLLDGNHTAEAIAASVAAEFDIELEQAAQDVLGFLDELDRHGMLLTSRQESPA